ncbi:hypothetical protein ACXKTX_20445 [Burkholderia gladioli]
MHEIQAEDIGELKIELHSDWSTAAYIGTRLQLQAEGLVPEEFTWPDGFVCHSWVNGGIIFSLIRQRPAGAKGPRRLYFGCDHWRLAMEPSGALGDLHAQRQIQMLEHKLAAMKHSNTEAGRRDWRELYSRIDQIRRDAAFQAFKALIPALTPQPKNRGGRPRKEVDRA